MIPDDVARKKPSSALVREADLIADREHLIDGLRTHLNPRTDESRLRWLYERNPHGKARVWVVTERESGSIVGSSAVLPRHFFVNGVRTSGCVFADSWTHPDYRFLGPAIALQRACLDAVLRGEFAVGYDLPHGSMIAIYRRLHMAAADQLVQYQKILRVDRFLGNRIRSRAMARALAILGNPFLALRDMRPRRKQGIVVEKASGRCGPEFDQFALATASSFGIQVARSAEYLNWRFLDHFHHRYEIIVARRSGRLTGYLVLLDDERNGQINVVDLLVEHDHDVLASLLGWAIDHCRERRRSVLSISMLSRDFRVAAVRARGFSAARSTPWILVAGTGVSVPSLRGSAGAAGFTEGDEAD